MPPRHRFYDPIVQDGSLEPVEAEPVEQYEGIRGVVVAEPGVYLLAEDVASTLRLMAENIPAQVSASEALLAAAESFQAADLPPDDGEEVMPVTPFFDTGTALPNPVIDAADLPVMPDAAIGRTLSPIEGMSGAASDSGVARVEIFPDSDGKWHARPVDETGKILSVSEGSFDRDYVERDARARWPERDLYELADVLGDSIWDEQATTFGFNGRRRPSPRRLWAT